MMLVASFFVMERRTYIYKKYNIIPNFNLKYETHAHKSQCKHQTTNTF